MWKQLLSLSATTVASLVWTLDDEGLILESRGNMDDAEYQQQLNADSPTIESNQ